ncbi:MAG: lipocalin family protein [Tannerella sp.]|jgi:hypothetical protein|nr:lipocalin family protein [Tannerella sp.]
MTKKKDILKFIFFIFLLLVNFSGCDKEKENISPEFEDGTGIVGTWQLMEFFDGGSISPGWRPIKDGYTYTFNADGTFTSTRFAECTHGTYELADNTLSLYFGCDGFDPYFINTSTFVELIFWIKDNTFHLVPIYMNCDEGCTFKFRRIKQLKSKKN